MAFPVALIADCGSKAALADRDRKNKRDDQENALPAAHSESSFRHQIRTAPTGSEYQACHPNQTTATPREGGVLQITANAKENRNLHGRSSHLGGTMKITHEHVVSIPKSRVLEFYGRRLLPRTVEELRALTVEILKRRQFLAAARKEAQSRPVTGSTDAARPTGSVHRHEHGGCCGSRMFYEITSMLRIVQARRWTEFIDNGAGTRLVFSPKSRSGCR